MKLELKNQIAELLTEAIQSHSDNNEWVHFADIGNYLSRNNFTFKAYGYEKLRTFLFDFDDILEIKEENDGINPPVFLARLSSNIKPYRNPKNDLEHKTCAKNSWLFGWANITNPQIEKLANMAIKENWNFGRNFANDPYAGLKNYLTYTFMRLRSENKVLYSTDTQRNEKYAAFNTGLVDTKYDWIYALFKENTYTELDKEWYLIDFVVPGEDAGKSLIRFFKPLPDKADYFKDNINNMFYDVRSGDLNTDYSHVISERIYRLPLDFIKANCPLDYLTIDGIFIDDVYFLPDRNENKQHYFETLSRNIKEDISLYNRIKNRFYDAEKLALKKVEWNYKTAVPMYFPAKDRISLLLPLCLTNESIVDLALVVTRNDNGSYQGETVLPLEIAYSNSRLITKPDSDWLAITTKS